ncbi:hypothetical protein ACOME3_002669 [Neoechinorhynchus agilis]
MAAAAQARRKCDDCGQPDERCVVWACVSHGTFLCEECAGAHRSIGRHISQVKRLSDDWPPTLLAMIRELNGRCLVNSRILECNQLNDKPSPDDSYETKAAYIRNKYQNIKFANLPLNGNVTNATTSLAELVRSGRSLLDQALVLLLIGADPNAITENLDNQNTILVEAASRGLALMVELLCVWGGDPGITDCEGHTVDEICRSIDPVLSDRLIQIQNELTTRLETYAQRFLRTASVSRQPNIKMCRLTEHAFGDLLRDIFDEIDRRECNALTCEIQVNESTQPSDKPSIPFLFVPFLPVPLGILGWDRV